MKGAVYINVVVVGICNECRANDKILRWNRRVAGGSLNLIWKARSSPQRPSSFSKETIPGRGRLVKVALCSH